MELGFCGDQTENGTRFRILTLLDEHTRECLAAVHAAWSIRAVDAVTVIEAAIKRYGAPQHLRSDNGAEFIAYAIHDWLKERQTKTLYISWAVRGKTAISRAFTTGCGTSF